MTMSLFAFLQTECLYGPCSPRSGGNLLADPIGYAHIRAATSESVGKSGLKRRITG